MDETKIRAIRGLVFFAVLWFLPTAGRAATLSVDCSSASLQAAIDKAKPGDTLLVSGTCKENVAVLEETARVVLDGQGKATINGPDASKPTVVMRGRGITLKGFTVSGGRDAINVTQGGQAVIDGNTLQGAARNGIEVNRVSDAVLVNNTIQNNPSDGILISSNAAARIGFVTTLDKNASPNVIQNNGGNGITMFRSSSARLVGNTIRNNKRNGVSVTRGSQAALSSNALDGNGMNGIDVSRNSSVQLGSGRGTGILEAPNTTSASNTGVGIKCTVQSSADGRLGTINGKGGAKDFDPSCVDSLIP